MSHLPVGDSRVGEVDDLATLAKLDESILLNEVKVRYQNDRIYTYVGDILVSVNPFRDLGIYGKDFSNTYRMVKRREARPPHIFAVADRLYQDMLGLCGSNPRNQCVLISGESGAGKTECTKLIIRQLIDLCKGNSQLQQQILQVNPLLEAFGNAQTLMNDNSSRFGKYIQLKFVKGRVLGAKISEYLLEKTRMVQQNEGEGNFHIFYYMFAGLSLEEQRRYKLQDAASYEYFSDGASCLQTDAKLLKERYDELINAIDMVGFTDDEQEDMFAVLAATLAMGNIEVKMDDNSDAVVKENSDHIKTVTDLLGLHKMEMHSCLSCSITYTKGEQIRRNYTKAQSEDARDAVAKALYGRLFSWIVNRINTLLVPRESFNPDKVQEIGILDIFGFEHFEQNSFEQACINLANEQLQFFFNKHIFMLEQEEYRGEGINWKEIKFVDNKSLLDLFLARPIGILALLDEESFFPKGTNQSYVAKMNQKFSKNPNYIRSTQGNAESFTIAHYAGHVTYDSTDWLEKNRDTVPPGVMEMLQQSTNKLLSLIFKGKISRTGTLALNHKTTKKSNLKQPRQAAEETKQRKLTVGHQFKNSLNVLMERMTESQPVFIRCIKPNSRKSSNLFEDEYVKAQLLYTGMLETTKIRREGFAIRPSFREFVERYKLLIHVFKLEPSGTSCKKILDSTRLTGWQIGKTKVFLKYWHLDKLGELMDCLASQAVHMQRVVRGFLGRRRAQLFRQEAEILAQEVTKLLHLVDKDGTTAMNDQNRMLNGDKNVPKAFFDKNKSNKTAPTIVSFGNASIAAGGKTDKKDQPRHTRNGQELDSDSGDEDDFVPVDLAELAKFGKPGTKMAAMNWFMQTQKMTIQHSEDGFAEWFHGFISRREAEKLLRRQPLGSFLIRISESRIGYSLSFKAKDRCRHYMIDQLPNEKLMVVGEVRVHRTLHHLIDYLKKFKLSNWDGVLTEPCGQAPGQCDYAELLDENDSEYIRCRSSKGMSVLPPLPERNYSVPGSVEGSTMQSSVKLPTNKKGKKKC